MGKVNGLHDHKGPLEVERKSSHPALFNPFARRLHVALLLMSGFFAVSYMRTNLSMALVCMVNSTALAQRHRASPAFENASRVPQGCSLPESVVHEYEGSLVWSSTQQGALFSAMFWGGLVTTLPAGWLSDRYGAKAVFVLAAVLHIIGTLLTPTLATHADYWTVFGARLIVGFGQGFVMPSMSSMVAHWIPPWERSTVGAIYTSGNQLAGIVGSPVAAFLCTSTALGGWPSIFYLCGTIGIAWVTVWTLLVSNTPSECLAMSPEESAYLELALKGQTMSRENRKISNHRVPWKAMLLSPAVHSVLAVFFAANFIVTFLQSYLPTYFKDVLYLDMRSNGLFSALPFAVQLASKFVVAPLADKLKKSKRISPTTISKICQTICFFGAGSMLMLLGFLVDCSRPVLALVLLCVQGVFLSAMIPGALTSMLSIAPAYTGTVTSLCMISGMIGNIIAPLFVGQVITHGSSAEWRIIFLTTAALLFLSGTLFIFFASAEVQPWAIVQPDLSALEKGGDDEAAEQKKLTDSLDVAA